MKFAKLRKTVVTVLLLFSACSLFAVDEYVSKLYKDIDIVFVNKSDEGLNEILQTNKEDKNYYLIENYAEKKIRRLIVVNDYEFAMDAIVVVIENNLDNEEAVEMYSIIVEAYEVQQAYEEQKERERQLELARIEGEKEKQRDNVDKEYLSSKTAEGGSVYVTGKETTLTNYNCDFTFGLLNFALVSDSSPKYLATNYGLSAKINYIYNLEKVGVGLDAYGALNFLSISTNNDGLPLLTDVEFAAKAAFKPLSKNLFARVGLSVMNTGKPKDVPAVVNVAGSLVSPIIGIELNKVQLGAAKLSVGADYLLGTAWTNGYKAGFQGTFDIALPYAQLEKVNLNFHVGIKDRFLIKDTGNENRAAIILAIGAENVNK